MTFATPRDLAVARDGAPATVLHRVSRAEGRIMRIADDTLFLAMEDTGAAQSTLAGEAAIRADENTRIELLQFSRKRTAALTVGILAAAVAALAIILVLNDSAWTWTSTGSGYGF